LCKHSLLDLGEAWRRDVRQRLPADVTARVLGKHTAGGTFNTKDDDLLVLLARACPGQGDAASFLDWFGALAPGAAYEALAARLPESARWVVRPDQGAVEFFGDSHRDAAGLALREYQRWLVVHDTQDCLEAFCAVHGRALPALGGQQRGSLSPGVPGTQKRYFGPCGAERGGC
jgi:hypothetical protein